MFWVICFSYLTSVGTDFMARLQEQLKYFVHNKLSTDKAWQGVNVYLSGHEVSYVTSEFCVVCVSVKFFWFLFLLRPLVKESTRSWSSSVLRPPNLVITQTQDTAFMVWMPTWWVQLCITDFFFFQFSNSPVIFVFILSMLSLPFALCCRWCLAWPAMSLIFLSSERRFVLEAKSHKRGKCGIIFIAPSWKFVFLL